MEGQEKANLLIYRFREQGLEVFLVEDAEGKQWRIPGGDIPSSAQVVNIGATDDVIELDPIEANGIFEQAYAVEGDWHDIPSMKSILKNDVSYMKGVAKDMVPTMMEKGTFVAVKEAFKKVLPNQYKMIKELKDIIIDRNSTKYM